MTTRKMALHGRVTGATPASVQKYTVTISGELGALTPAEAKAAVFKAVKTFVREIPGAQEFWVSQPKGPRKNGKGPSKPRASRAEE